MAIREVVSERGRWGPTPKGHPTIGSICPGCGEPIRAGDVPALVNPSPPGPDDGAFYNAEVEVAHERCAFTEAPDAG